MAKKDLSQFSREELEQELARRNREGDGQAGKDWYFFPHCDDGHRTIAIVHRRFWHRRHCLQDCQLGRLVTVPSDFDECMESHFEFDGSLKEARRRLKAMGYREVRWSFGFSVNHRCSIGGKATRVECVCDTAKLCRTFHERVSSRVSFADTREYREWVESFVPNTVFDFTSHNLDGAYIRACWMKRSVAESLPPYPDRIRE